MTTALITMGLAVVVLGVVLGVLLKVRTPYYRFDRNEMTRVLNLVWTLLVAAPLRHDPELARLRRRCREIADTELVNMETVQFSPAGRAQLEAVLCELESMQEDK